MTDHRAYLTVASLNTEQRAALSAAGLGHSIRRSDVVAAIVVQDAMANASACARFGTCGHIHSGVLGRRGPICVRWRGHETDEPWHTDGIAKWSTERTRTSRSWLTEQEQQAVLAANLLPGTRLTRDVVDLALAAYAARCADGP